MIKAVVTKFNKLSGWSKGPMKPSVTTYEGTASSVRSSINSALSDLGDLSGAEAVTITIKYEEDED